MQAETRYVRNEDYIFRKIVDELVLVPIRQDVADMDCIYTMNPVAAFLWDRLDGGATLAELQTALVAAYDVDPTTAAGDVLEFINQLEVAGAVRSC